MQWRENPDGALCWLNRRGQVCGAVYLRGNGWRPMIYSELAFTNDVADLICAREMAYRPTKREAMRAVEAVYAQAGELDK